MKSLALENCDCNSSEIAYMGTFVPVFACSFYVGHVCVYSSLEVVGWRCYVIMVITGHFSMFVFTKNPSLSLHISICLLLDTIA